MSRRTRFTIFETRLALLPALVLAFSCGGAGERGDDGAKESGGTEALVRDAVDACKILSREEVERAVGNPVKEGAYNVGSHLCSWDTETLEDVSVVLTVWAEGDVAMASLCDGVRTAAAGGSGIPDVGEAASWSYRSSAMIGGSADLEVCHPKAWLGISLSGKRDEGAMQEAARTLALTVLDRL